MTRVKKSPGMKVFLDVRRAISLLNEAPESAEVNDALDVLETCIWTLSAGMKKARLNANGSVGAQVQNDRGEGRLADPTRV